MITRLLILHLYILQALCIFEGYIFKFEYIQAQVSIGTRPKRAYLYKGSAGYKGSSYKLYTGSAGYEGSCFHFYIFRLSKFSQYLVIEEWHKGTKLWMWEYHAGSVTGLIIAAEFVIKPSTFILYEHMEICSLIFEIWFSLFKLTPDRSQKLPNLNNNISKNISLKV